jgi:CubicO group peptidase (beta-lactamase class C family)
MGCSDPVALQFGESVFWTFEVNVNDHLLTVQGVTSTSFAVDPRCKARRWAEAIDPSFTPDRLEWDDDPLIGKPCIIDVVYFEGADGLRSTVKEVYKWENPPSEPKSDVS